MTTKLNVVAAGIVMIILASMPVLAHHSFSAEFDAAKPVIHFVMAKLGGVEAVQTLQYQLNSTIRGRKWVHCAAIRNVSSVRC